MGERVVRRGVGERLPAKTTWGRVVLGLKNSAQHRRKKKRLAPPPPPLQQLHPLHAAMEARINGVVRKAFPMRGKNKKSPGSYCAFAAFEGFPQTIDVIFHDTDVEENGLPGARKPRQGDAISAFVVQRPVQLRGGANPSRGASTGWTASKVHLHRSMPDETRAGTHAEVDVGELMDLSQWSLDDAMTPADQRARELEVGIKRLQAVIDYIQNHCPEAYQKAHNALRSPSQARAASTASWIAAAATPITYANVVGSGSLPVHPVADHTTPFLPMPMTNLVSPNLGTGPNSAGDGSSAAGGKRALAPASGTASPAHKQPKEQSDTAKFESKEKMDTKKSESKKAKALENMGTICSLLESSKLPPKNIFDGHKLFEEHQHLIRSIRDRLTQLDPTLEGFEGSLTDLKEEKNGLLQQMLTSSYMPLLTSVSVNKHLRKHLQDNIKLLKQANITSYRVPTPNGSN